MRITIGLADDHVLFLKSLATLINTLDGLEVVADAPNGEDLAKQLKNLEFQPDLLLIDVDMPVMNGVSTTKWVKENYPNIKTVALSMNDDDKTIIKMIQAGCCAYLLKDIHPNELEIALKEIMAKGFYNSDIRYRNYARLISESQQSSATNLNETELQFLQLACSDLTYKQIAGKMNKAERTIDGYREVLFDKLNVQSRVGMALEAVRKKLVKL
jgi:DNA-binding NarL/FixJ family response regulator